MGLASRAKSAQIEHDIVPCHAEVTPEGVLSSDTRRRGNGLAGNHLTGLLLPRAQPCHREYAGRDQRRRHGIGPLAHVETPERPYEQQGEHDTLTWPEEPLM